MRGGRCRLCRSRRRFLKLDIGGRVLRGSGSRAHFCRRHRQLPSKLFIHTTFTHSFLYRFNGLLFGEVGCLMARDIYAESCQLHVACRDDVPPMMGPTSRAQQHVGKTRVLRSDGSAKPSYMLTSGHQELTDTVFRAFAQSAQRERCVD